jgi:FKBP-type peptidyl-prolyl cis-trans isomerase FkpA
MKRLLLIALLVGPALMAACGGGGTPAEPPAATAPPPNTVGPALTPPPGTATKEGASNPAAAPEKPTFTRTDLQVGTGREAIKGKRISMHYTGWLYDPKSPNLKGRMFDSSASRGPFNFVLGTGFVIPGWDQGIVGMKVGGKRRLIIPPELAYGRDGGGGGIIPPNATLVFDTELLDVQD